MTKWIALLFVVALVGSGVWASQDDAPSWAPAMPTVVLAAGVISGLVHAIRYGLRRRKDMQAVAATLGMSFDKHWSRDRFRELGLGALNLFVYCRPPEDLSFLQRAVAVQFWNVMRGRAGRSELYVFDFTTSTRSGGPNQRGTFVCFRTPGGSLPELEITPRLWSAGPEWAKELTSAPTKRSELRAEDPAFDAEYRVEAVDEAASRSVLGDALRRLLSRPAETGWRLEMSDEWLAVTRLAPAKNIGGLTDPMAADAMPPDQRKSYFEHPVGPDHVARLVEKARSFHELVAGNR